MNSTSAPRGPPAGAILRDPEGPASLRADALFDSASEAPFDAVARLARRLLRATWAFVTFADESAVHYRSAVGPRVPEVPTSPPVEEWFCAYVVDAQQPLLVADTRRDPRFSGHASVAEGRFRSCAGAPVVVDGLCVGSVCVIDEQPRAWSENDAETLRALAAEVGAAVCRHRQSVQTRASGQAGARGHAEALLRARNRQLLSLTRISRLLILGDPAEEQSMQAVFTEISRLIGMETFLHFRLSDRPGALRLHSAGGITHGMREQLATIEAGAHLCGEIAESHAPVLVEHLHERAEPDAQVLARQGAKSFAGFPLIAHGKLLGTLAYVSREHARLDGAELQMVLGICDQVAAMLERADLLEALHDAHALLADRESQLRIAIDASRATVFEWDIGRNRVHRIMSTHPAFPETSARLDSLEDVIEAVHPEDREMFRANVRSALDSATHVYASEHRVVDAQGNVAWVVESGRVERDADGRPVRLLGVSQDVTERKQTLSNLQASRAFSRQVTDVVPAILYIYDLVERRNVWGNREMVAGLGYSREQIDAMAGVLLQQLIHPDDWPRYLKHAGKLMRLPDNEVAEFEYRLRKSDGSWCWLYSRDMVFKRSAEGSPRQIVGAAVDITDRKEAEARLMQIAGALQQEHARKDQFLAMLAHELRNPLAPLRNVCHLLSRAPVRDAVVEHASGVIERQVRNLARLVDDLLDVSRVANGKLTLKSSPLDLAMVVRQAVEIARPLIDSKGHQLVLTIPADGVLCVQGDATRLTQVVVNLLNNAAKYTQRAGFIAVSGEVERDEVVLRITDNGSGIAPELLPHIFEMYAQVDRSLEHSQGGLGIGLALVKSLVALHRGGVEAVSTPGRGSTFTVRLPRSGTPCLTAYQDAPVATSTSRRVLIVDDDPDAGETLSLLLRLAGHTVRYASHPGAALAVAPELNPDVCILDIGLPGMNGLDLARHLRTLPQTQAALFIALSGYGKPEDKAEAEAAGFAWHLTKPIDPEQLQALLTQAREDGE